MKVFISGFDNTTNEDHTDALKKILEHYELAPEAVTGCYKGVKERSLMVDVPYDQLWLISHLLTKFNQESALMVDPDRQAYLCSNIAENEMIAQPIGIFDEVDSVEGLDGYSIINNKYYSVIGE